MQELQDKVGYVVFKTWNDNWTENKECTHRFNKTFYKGKKRSWYLKED